MHVAVGNKYKTMNEQIKERRGVRGVFVKNMVR